MEDNFNYLRWLEDRWEVHKHDHYYSSAEREEKRTEGEALQVQKLISEGMAPKLARAEVIGDEEDVLEI